MPTSDAIAFWPGHEDIVRGDIQEDIAGFLKPRCGHGSHVAAKCVEAKGLEKRDILRLPRITC